MICTLTGQCGAELVAGKELGDGTRVVCGGENSCFSCVHDCPKGFSMSLETVQEGIDVLDGKEAIDVVHLCHH